ncbi:MAG: lipid-binding SYLF domain-containing protein [Rubrivivax sp.]|nr:lipid-binding SYLF domain-containing protein [Rubrivivax sp.]
MKAQRRMTLMAIAATAAALAIPAGTAWASDADDAISTVDKARVTFTDLVKGKEFDSLRAGLKTAKGVIIYPSVLKAGFILGGSGGTGVLLVRGANNEWSEPAFYTMGSVSFGAQIGGSAAEVVVVINSQKAVDSLMTNSVKLGGDASVAAGPVGAGQAANLMADFVSYSRSKGAFVGMSIDGSVLDVRASLNSAYYGMAVTPIDILVKGAVSNKHSAALRSAVAAASK